MELLWRALGIHPNIGDLFFSWQQSFIGMHPNIGDATIFHSNNMRREVFLGGRAREGVQ